MPLYSNQGQYQTAHRRTRRRRRRKNWFPVVLAVLLVCSAAGVAAWAVWPKADAPTVTEPTGPLELPAGVQVQPLVLADCAEPAAEEFVTGLDETGITVSFAETPDTALGEQTVELVFTDGKRSCTAQTTLYRFHLESEAAVAADSGEMADIRAFVPDETVEAVFVGTAPEDVDHSVCGDVTLTIACGGREYQVVYSIEDRTAPEATVKELTVEAGTTVEPADLIAQIVDDSEVTVTFGEEPELAVLGSHPVRLILTDSMGNTAEVESVIHVTAAADAPRFEGLTDIRILVGNTIAYKSGVTATDPQDGEVTYTVDAGQVDRMTEGTYTVYYTATDADGNTTIAPRTVSVEQINQAAVDHYAQKALDQIITPDMTRDQQIFAVYKYTKSNVTFVGTSDKTDVVHGAYEGFTTGKGDCYTYYAMNVVMLDLLGIENLEVTRINGETHHWWNLVQYEDGKYYHVDSCPVAVTIDGVYHWKMTDTDLKTYTDGVSWRKINFYTYDKTLPEYQDIEIAP